MSDARNIGREIGTAFAVLAIYLLTILAPLHHARASQLALQDLGYVTLETGWVLCTPDGAAGDERDVLVAKCPATGAGKPAAIAPALAVVTLDLSAAFVAAPLTPAVTGVVPLPIAPPAGPRAPPVLA